mgnify:FL=1
MTHPCVLSAPVQPGEYAFLSSAFRAVESNDAQRRDLNPLVTAPKAQGWPHKGAPFLLSAKLDYLTHHHSLIGCPSVAGAPVTEKVWPPTGALSVEMPAEKNGRYMSHCRMSLGQAPAASAVISACESEKAP